jgi:prevent-host-death family protein
MTFSVHEAKTQFSKLLDLVEHGEEIVILRHGKPVAQLVVARNRKRPQFGALKDAPKWPENWDEPLSDSEADAFWDGRW